MTFCYSSRLYEPNIRINDTRSKFHHCQHLPVSWGDVEWLGRGGGAATINVVTWLNNEMHVTSAARTPYIYIDIPSHHPFTEWLRMGNLVFLSLNLISLSDRAIFSTLIVCTRNIDFHYDLLCVSNCKDITSLRIVTRHPFFFCMLFADFNVLILNKSSDCCYRCQR